MQEQQNNLFEGVSIDTESRQTLISIASWAMIVVVTSVIGYVIGIIGLFRQESTASIQSEGFGTYFKMGGDDTTSTVISIVIGAVMNYFLYRFASMAKTSVAGNSEEQLAGSFRSLKIYFAISTVLLVIILLFVLLAAAAIL